MRRSLPRSVRWAVPACAALTALAALVPTTLAQTSTLPQGDRGGATSTSVAPQDAPSIIPRPGAGREPEDQGDRGGVLQVAVLAGIVGGVAVLGLLAYRSSSRT